MDAKAGATVFYGSSNTGHDGVIGWNYGSGRVISFSTLITDIELGNPNYERLFVNATEWAAVPGIEPCEGDFDLDGDVDGSDLAVFAAGGAGISLGGPGYNPVADFDGDGYVDESDLAAFAAEFGSTDCPICP